MPVLPTLKHGQDARATEKIRIRGVGGRGRC